MNLKFLDYKFEVCINKYKEELLFLGATYYDKWFVFKHLIPKTEKLLGFDIIRTELAFDVDELVSIWFFTDEKKFDDLLMVVESYLSKKATLNDYELFRPPTNIDYVKYYWIDEGYTLCLGYNENTDEYYIYLTKEQYCLHLFN